MNTDSTLRRAITVAAISALLAATAICAVIAYRVLRQVNLRATLDSAALAAIQTPPGFNVSVFAEGLNGPRFMAVDADGVLYVADRGNNRIVALPDSDGDGVADSVRVFAEGLNSPSSLAFYDGALYVGNIDSIVRLIDADGDGVAESSEIVVGDLPTIGVHITRTVLFLPDGRMVVSIGSSCNVCQESDPRRAAVVVYDVANGGGESLFAVGLRNAVGLALHPESGELWATNNGRDLMGDDLPPDTVYIVREGGDYGFPRCHSGDVPDPEFGGGNACDEVQQPAAKFQAHSAPLGLTFYTGGQFPSEYYGNLFVAFHGSWNRSVPTGYKVVRLVVENGKVVGEPQDFALGWLNETDGSISGRPVGVTVGADGALYVSDDKAGYIYRIDYTNP